MKLGDDLIKKKFDDVEEKVDFLIELCTMLQLEKEELRVKIKNLETELENKVGLVAQFSDQDVLIQSKIDGLLKKLNDFSKDATGDN